MIHLPPQECSWLGWLHHGKHSSRSVLFFVFFSLFVLLILSTELFFLKYQIVDLASPQQCQCIFQHFESIPNPLSTLSCKMRKQGHSWPWHGLSTAQWIMRWAYVKMTYCNTFVELLELKLKSYLYHLTTNKLQGCTEAKLQEYRWERLVNWEMNNKHAFIMLIHFLKVLYYFLLI